MSALIKSRPLNELVQYKNELLAKRKKHNGRGIVHLVVGMGPCGLEAGSFATLRAILSFAANQNLNQIVILRGGCCGSCDQEPIVQVQVGDEPNVLYGKVTPEMACQIMQEHVCGGNIVKEYLIRVEEPVS